jgi:Na+/melibiose symporter-like transporter
MFRTRNETGEGNMRSGGINWLAVIVAAVAIYAIGFVIYGMKIPAETWMAWEGITAKDMESVGSSRMPFSVVMPLMTAIFMAVIFKWARVAGASNGAKWGAVVAFASAIPAMMYGWVYGIGPVEVTLVDSGHILLGHVAAGAILGGWK